MRPGPGFGQRRTPIEDAAMGDATAEAAEVVGASGSASMGLTDGATQLKRIIATRFLKSIRGEMNQAGLIR
jgi:hypothetical protein